LRFNFEAATRKKWHSGKTRIEDGLVTVTAPDGRPKSAQLSSSSPETMARILLLDREREKSE
jgi:hypothetical protein